MVLKVSARHFNEKHIFLGKTSESDFFDKILTIADRDRWRQTEADGYGPKETETERQMERVRGKVTGRQTWRQAETGSDRQRQTYFTVMPSVIVHIVVAIQNQV
jgi:hypothetical protein